MLLSGLSLLERRAFLGASLATLSTFVPGCAGDPSSGRPEADGGVGSGGTSGADAAAEAGLDAGTDAALCSDPFAGGTLLEQMPFDGEGNLPLDTPTGQGWDGRLYTDLSKLDLFFGCGVLGRHRRRHDSTRVLTSNRGDRRRHAFGRLRQIH